MATQQQQPIPAHGPDTPMTKQLAFGKGSAGAGSPTGVLSPSAHDQASPASPESPDQDRAVREAEAEASRLPEPLLDENPQRCVLCCCWFLTGAGAGGLVKAACSRREQEGVHAWGGGRAGLCAWGQQEDCPWSLSSEAAMGKRYAPCAPTPHTPSGTERNAHIPSPQGRRPGSGCVDWAQGWFELEWRKAGLCACGSR